MTADACAYSARAALAVERTAANVARARTGRGLLEEELLVLSAQLGAPPSRKAANKAKAAVAATVTAPGPPMFGAASGRF